MNKTVNNPLRFEVVFFIIILKKSNVKDILFFIELYVDSNWQVIACFYEQVVFDVLDVPYLRSAFILIS